MEELLSMLSCKILAVGKLREEMWQEAQEKYLLQLRPYVKCSVVEVEPEAVTASRGAEASKKMEAERLGKAIKDVERVILLAEGGKAFDSEKFALYIKKLDEAGVPVTFVIGGSEGWDEGFRSIYKEAISLSPLTFPHEMARVVVLEQIYRAATINAGKTYHK